MDYLRTAYIVNMQFDEAGEIVVPIKWYFTSPTANTFPGSHAFISSRTWTAHQQPTVGIGERWDSTPSYYNGALPGKFPGTGNICGPIDWFQNGCPSDAPPVTIVNGVPACCPLLCQQWLEFPSIRDVVQLSAPFSMWTQLVSDTDQEVWQSTFDPTVTVSFEEDFITMCGSNNSTAASLQGTVFNVPGLCTDSDPSTFTGTYVFPNAPSPWNKLILNFKDTKGT